MRHLVDLSRIPHAGCFGNYKSWLKWSISRLNIGESLVLPIFSAYEIQRWKDGYILFANHRNEIGAFHGNEAVAGLIDTIETGIFLINTPKQKRLVRAATALKLQRDGKEINEIAEAIDGAAQTVRRFINVVAA